MRRKRCCSAFAAFGLAWLLATPLWAAEEAELTIVIEEIREPQGRVHIGVWSDPDGFAEGDKRIAGASTEVKGDREVLTIKGLAPGTYAIAVYHDANDNGEFDTTLVGLPAEGLGFSNGAWITILGAPSFEAAAIELKGPGTETVIPLKY